MDSILPVFTLSTEFVVCNKKCIANLVDMALKSSEFLAHPLQRIITQHIGHQSPHHHAQKSNNRSRCLCVLVTGAGG